MNKWLVSPGLVVKWNQEGAGLQPGTRPRLCLSRVLLLCASVSLPLVLCPSTPRPDPHA